MPKALRRFLMMVLTLATALVSLLLFILGFGKADLGEKCSLDEDCKPRLVCGKSAGAPYCTNACDVTAPDTCVKGYSCEKGLCLKE